MEFTAYSGLYVPHHIYTQNKEKHLLATGLSRRDWLSFHYEIPDVVRINSTLEHRVKMSILLKKKKKDPVVLRQGHVGTINHLPDLSVAELSDLGKMQITKPEFIFASVQRTLHSSSASSQ